MSEPSLDRYVWLWRPDALEPVLCGHLRWDGQAAAFAYVRSFRERVDAMSLQPDWPVTTALGDRLYPPEDDALPGVIADVAPGRWAEYVLEHAAGRALNPMERLIHGFGDRTGALEFTETATSAPVQEPPFVALDEVAQAVEAIERGRPVDPKIALLFRHGASLGGRRPKATVEHQGRLWIAKFVSVKDRDELQPRREAFGLALGRAVGLTVPDFQVIEVRKKPVLLVARFDREASGTRRHVLSARTLLRLSERRMLDSASYPAIGQLLRQHSDDAGAAAEWFDRMVFNIVLGNTDDHALNHLFGWNGAHLSLMPAFDLEPQVPLLEPRVQEMIVGKQGRRGTFGNALSAAADFGLSMAKARGRVRSLIERCRASGDKSLHVAGLLKREAADELLRSLQSDDPA